MSCKFLHPHSTPCGTVETNLFQIPQTQVGIADSGFVEVAPTSSYDDYDSLIEYNLPASSELYTDPGEIYMYIKGRIQYADGSLPKSTEVVYLQKDFHSTFFKNVEVLLNDVSTQVGPTHHALQTHIGTLLNYGPGAKGGHLTSAGHYQSLEYEKNKFQRSTDKVFDMYAKLQSPIFNQPKLLLSGVELRIRLTRTTPAYYIYAPDAAVNAKKPFVKIMETYLMVRKVKLTPNMYLDIENRLKTETAKYVMDRVDLKVRTLATGTNSANIDNLVLGTLPKKIIVCFQNNNVFNGRYDESSFNFNHYDITSCALYVNGNLLTKPYETLFSSDDKKLSLCSRAYLNLMANTNGLDVIGNGIMLNEYSDDQTFFAFNLEPAFDDCFTIVNPVKTGELSLKLTFKTPLPSVISCIILMQFPGMIEIDSSRQVIISQI